MGVHPHHVCVQLDREAKEILGEQTLCWHGDLWVPVVQLMFAPAPLNVQVHIGCICSWEGLLACMAVAHQAQPGGAS